MRTFFHFGVLAAVFSLLLARVYTSEATGKSNSVRWVPRRSISESDIAKQETGGTDFEDPLYIVRTNYSGGVLPGKQWRNQSRIFFCFDGRERTVDDDYELLLFPHGSLTWVNVTTPADFPPNPFPGGTDPETGQTLYICRASLDAYQLVLGSLLVDKSGHGKSICKVPWGYKEWDKDKYELLVYSTSRTSGEGGSHNMAWGIGYFFIIGICVSLLIAISTYLYKSKGDIFRSKLKNLQTVPWVKM